MEPGNQSADANKSADANDGPTSGVPISCTIGGGLVPSPKTCEAEFLSTLDTHDIAPTDIARSIPVPGGDDIGLMICGLGVGEIDLPARGRSDICGC